MPLSVGDRLGPYQILAPLGAGGMGEVYKARDTRLDRIVAIKVSKTEFSERFEREARAVAALNHQNICQLYDVGPNYLVMEYIEGTPLKGPLPLDQALSYAVQICDALDAAHKKNITHRDLKPANILVTKADVKLLDFGLAKMGPVVKADEATMTMALTGKNEIVGTLLYMSPEQLQSKEADARSDIFSFGLVLYEVLTGKRAFDGGNAASIIAAILERPAPSVAEIAPAALDRVLRKCLAKDPDDRWQTARDLKDELEWINSAPEHGSAVSATPKDKSWLTKLPWIATVLLAVIALGVSFIHFREGPPQVRVVNTTLLPPDGAAFDFGTTYALPALSQDGTRIVFGARSKEGKSQLYVRRLDSPTAQPLPGTEGATFPFWSPDSRWVGFGQVNKLKKIDINGGPAVTIADYQGGFRGGSWNTQGVIIFGVNTGSSILRVTAAGGTTLLATPVAALDAAGNVGNPVYPWFLPDGRHFLYTTLKTGDIPIRIGSLDQPSKSDKVLAQAHSNAVYAQGHLLYLRENTLMAQPFDPDRLETKAEAVPLAEGVSTYLQPSRRATFTVSADGLLAYQSGGSAAGFRLAWKDRQGKELGNLGEPGDETLQMALSPDGKRLAALAGRGGDIWIYDTARGIRTRFTFTPGVALFPAWSPDGETIYYSSGFNLFRKASNGASSEELLLSDSATLYPSSVSPDGKALLYDKYDERTNGALWVLPVTPAQPGGKPEPRVFLQTPFNEIGGQFSPDGNWVAYFSDESGVSEVYIAPYPGPGGKRQISSGGGRYPLWRRDGKELFYVTPAGDLMAAEVAARNKTLEIGRVQKLFEGIIQRAGNYAVSADGQKFVVVENTGTSTPRPLTLIENWPATLPK